VVDKIEKKHDNPDETEAQSHNQVQSNLAQLAKIKELYLALEKKKEDLIESGIKLNPSEKCKYCFRFGTSSTNDSKMSNYSHRNDMYSTVATSFDIG